MPLFRTTVGWRPSGGGGAPLTVGQVVTTVDPGTVVAAVDTGAIVAAVSPDRIIAQVAEEPPA